MKRIVMTYLFMFLIFFAKAQELKNPTFEEVISLKSASNAMISPDGKHVVFVLTSTDWKENRYDSELWLSKDGDEPFQLTNNIKNSSSNPRWSPDGEWISFISDRDNKNQLHIIRIAGGEAFPMTNINNASTPTLIQHGEFDQRVPIANGYELVQGLRDVGVDTELIVYKGFGHGISKPKERLAATWHNWQWFAKFIWGEEIGLPEN